jgi:F-box interacting protein
VWEVFVRLPAKDILRCRAVCRSWRNLTSADDFILAHHRRQPSFHLLTLYGTANADPIFERGHRVLGFNEYRGFKIHASCDGLLLLSLSNGSFSICNPTTRQCTALPRLTAAGCINIAALYLHSPSGEYRVLYKEKGNNYLEAALYQGINAGVAYYILEVHQGHSARCIGVPLDPPGIEEVMQEWRTSLDLPVVFRNCLHWDPGCSHSDIGIVVFDTVAESFRFLRRPADATRSCTLFDMGGSIGFSCFANGRREVDIWVLEDYKKEIWSFKYHLIFPVDNLCNTADTEHLVLSHKGDVLVYNRKYDYMFHCDNTGKLLEKIRCDPWNVSVTGHCLKENLAKHDFSLKQGFSFFQRI